MSIINYEFSDSIAKVRCTNADENNITVKTNGAEWVFFTEEDVDKMKAHFEKVEKP